MDPSSGSYLHLPSVTKSALVTVNILGRNKGNHIWARFNATSKAPKQILARDSEMLKADTIF